MTSETIAQDAYTADYNDAERVQALANISFRRAELKKIIAEAEAEIVVLDAVEAGHIAAMSNRNPN